MTASPARLGKVRGQQTGGRHVGGGPHARLVFDLRLPRHPFLKWILIFKRKKVIFLEHVPKMVPAQNVLPRSQLDTPPKTQFLGVQFGTCSGRNQFLEVQFGTRTTTNQFLEVQLGTCSGKVNS